MNNNLSEKKYLYWWLLTCCFMIFTMVFIGGLTRLTDSGLSIVEWNVFTGIIPPLSNNDWIDLFNKYKQFPEYKLINKNMLLNDFKFIFWMEYIHRIWGRLIFLIFLIPLIIFQKKKIIPLKFKKHLYIILLLILLQGFLGWYMVKSGLVNQPDVSHYRLSIHLIIAFIIYGYLVYLAISAYELIKKKRKKTTKSKKLYFLISLIIFLILITIFSGGLVAGLDAGLVYSSFPLMGESFIPAEFWDINPKFLNFLKNPVTVQFDHRILGMTTGVLIFLIWIYSRIKNIDNNLKYKINILLLFIIFQISLGIATLQSYVAIPIALFHQSGALIIFTISIWILKSLPLVTK
mgnify:CR=1 FL=1|tara:strand:+ start:2994 stop:4037 length:1044 start_codon:yes stop_codon:yes gene_type:complete